MPQERADVKGAIPPKRATCPRLRAAHMLQRRPSKAIRQAVFAVKPRLTIRDIAREAEVSTATVSRVMNSPDRVAPNTLSAVQKVIDRHGYLSHGIAMSLASSRSMSIGLVIPTIVNSIYASSTQAIQGIAQSAGYTVLLGVSEFSPELEEKLIRQLLERRVDGLILIDGDRPAPLPGRHRPGYCLQARPGGTAASPRPRAGALAPARGDNHAGHRQGSRGALQHRGCLLPRPGAIHSGPSRPG